MEEKNVVEGPESYYCPISGELMTDPVIDPEGNTYNRDSIEAWLAKNATSPVTRAPLTADRLAPNRALSEAIEAWRKEHGAAAVQKVAPKALGKGNVKAVARVFARPDGQGTHDVIVALEPESTKERSASDVVAVIDISGSMDQAAEASGGAEENGLSILDITKHAVLTIIETLGPNDRFALVSYSDKARIELQLTAMTASGKKDAETRLKALHTEGSTNLWDGLLKGMDVLRAKEREGRFASVFLLTDGQPNVKPPRGHLQMLQRYKEEHQVNYTINTFGFGYNLDSALLDELAVEGGGAYAFIPEPNFVGTVLVHAMTNALCTAASEVTLSVEPTSQAKVVRVVGGYPIEEASWGVKASLGTLQKGQTRSIVIRVDLSDLPAGKSCLNATLEYKNARGETARLEIEAASDHLEASDDSVYQFARSHVAETVGQIMGHMKKGASTVPDASAMVAQCIKDIRVLEHSCKALDALMQDVEGQMTEATSRADWWKKWGRHYLPSLGRAHLLQQCNNFKDPGVQIYGGELFQKQRDVADTLFLKLPPPTPSRKKYGGGSYSAPVSMSDYYDSAAVCFSPDSLVEMHDGSLRQCREILAGDLLAGGARVRCVIKTQCPEGVQSLVRLSAGLRITPWHPVRMAGKWTFPVHCAPTTLEPLEATFNFILDSQHTMTIGGIECCTLGHGIVNDDSDVRSSQYWGADVVKDLACMPGFDEGYVNIVAPKIARNVDTQTVSRLIDLSV